MSLKLEVQKGNVWIDCSPKLTYLSHKIRGDLLESLEFTLIDEALSPNDRVRYRFNDVVKFEGFVVSVRKSLSRSAGFQLSCRAVSELIIFDRHVVYREYAMGTRAGTIIKDLASLESRVDVTNVDEAATPQLTAPWTIQNESALKVMQSVARGTNYWLRMCPGRMLFFKPKSTGTPAATIDNSSTISAEYLEDRWRLKNRVIYVGADGQILADVSEGAGDLPVVVHDPFLTSASEAQRRANIRLALNREYGRKLKLVLRRDFVERSSIDLFSTVAVNMPTLGLSNVNMYVVSIDYQPAAPFVTLEVGGRLELFEDYISEVISGDIAARFGGVSAIPELASTVFTIEENVRYLRDVRYPTYINKPPLSIHQGANVTHGANGEIALISGATSGHFVVSVAPTAPSFTSFISCEWIAEKGQGTISFNLLNTEDENIISVVDAADTKKVIFPRWPRAINGLSEFTARVPAWSRYTWRIVPMGIIGRCIKVEL